jgi:hypothetical protein
MFIKVSAQRMPDPANGGEGAADPFAGYEGKIDGEIKGDAPGGDPLAISEEEKAELAKATADKDIIREEKKTETPKTPEEIAAEKPAKTETEDEGGNDEKEEITLEDLEGEKLPDASPEDEYSWEEIGKEIGLEVEENSIEGIKKAVESTKEKIRQEAINEYLENEKGYSPEAVRLVNALNAGATDLEIFENQVAYIDFLAMTPEEKIIQQALANGLTEAKGKQRYEELIEEGTLEDTISAIDKSVRTMMLAKRNDLLNSYQQVADQKKNDAIQKSKQENELILKAINERAEFSGKKLSPEVKKQIAARWNQGVYRKAFESDPNAVVDFILHRELGKKITTDQVSEAEKQAKKNVHSKLHNLDTAKSESRQASHTEKPKKELDPSDPFADYKGLNEDADYRLTYGG